MSYFKAKMHQIRHRLRLPPQTSLGELTALPQTPSLYNNTRARTCSDRLMRCSLTRPVPILRFKVRSTDVWRARRARAYNGGLGAEPPAGSVRGSGGEAPLKLKAFEPFNVQ